MGLNDKWFEILGGFLLSIHFCFFLKDSTFIVNLIFFNCILVLWILLGFTFEFLNLFRLGIYFHFGILWGP